MKRRLIDDGGGWTIEEKINPKTGEPIRNYYFKDRLAVRVKRTKVKACKQAAGFYLIEKDVRTLKKWIALLHKELESFGAEPDEEFSGDFMPDEERFYVSRALFVAIVTTYAKIFTEARGRGVQLDRKGWIPEEHRETHDWFMHVRHTFVAHSGVGSDEMCEVVVAIDQSPKNRTPPRHFMEMRQPASVNRPLLDDLTALLDDLQERLLDRLDRTKEHLRSRLEADFDEAKLKKLRRGTTKRMLSRKES